MNMSRTIAGAVGRQGPVEAVVVIRAGNLSACLVCSGQYGVAQCRAPDVPPPNRAECPAGGTAPSAPI